MGEQITPEQRAEIKARGEQLGQEDPRVEQEWVKLIAEMRAEMERGTDPKRERVQATAERSRELVMMFSGGNPAIEGRLADMYRQGAGASFGIDAELAAYGQKATT